MPSTTNLTDGKASNSSVVGIFGQQHWIGRGLAAGVEPDPCAILEIAADLVAVIGMHTRADADLRAIEDQAIDRGHRGIRHFDHIGQVGIRRLAGLAMAHRR